MQFSVTTDQIVGWRPPPLSGWHLFWKILDPPLLIYSKNFFQVRRSNRRTVSLLPEPTTNDYTKKTDMNSGPAGAVSAGTRGKEIFSAEIELHWLHHRYFITASCLRSLPSSQSLPTSSQTIVHGHRAQISKRSSRARSLVWSFLLSWHILIWPQWRCTISKTLRLCYMKRNTADPLLMESWGRWISEGGGEGLVHCMSPDWSGREGAPGVSALDDWPSPWWLDQCVSLTERRVNQKEYCFSLWRAGPIPLFSGWFKWKEEIGEAKKGNDFGIRFHPLLVVIFLHNLILNNFQTKMLIVSVTILVRVRSACLCRIFHVSMFRCSCAAHVHYHTHRLLRSFICWHPDKKVTTCHSVNQ